MKKISPPREREDVIDVDSGDDDDDDDEESYTADRPNFMGYFKAVDETTKSILKRVEARRVASEKLRKTVNGKYREKGYNIVTTDGNSMIQLIVDYVVSAKRGLTHDRLRRVVHEMVYVYMDTHRCLITHKGIRTFRDRILKRSQVITANDLEEYFGKKFLARPR